MSPAMGHSSVPWALQMLQSLAQQLLGTLICSFP